MITKQIEFDRLNTINFTFQHPGFSFFKKEDNVIQLYFSDPTFSDVVIESYTCEGFKLYTDNKDNYLTVPVSAFHCKFRGNEAYFQLEGSEFESLSSGPVKIEYILSSEGFDYSYTVPTDAFVPYTVNESVDINARNISKLRDEVNALKEIAGQPVDLTDIQLAINEVERKILEVKSTVNAVITTPKSEIEALTQEEYDNLDYKENKLYIIIEQ